MLLQINCEVLIFKGFHNCYLFTKSQICLFITNKKIAIFPE